MLMQVRLHTVAGLGLPLFLAPLPKHSLCPPPLPHQPGFLKGELQGALSLVLNCEELEL